MKKLFKDTSGEETLKACFEATELALMMLRASIKNNNPKFSEKEIESEVERIVKMQRMEEDEFARKFYAGKRIKRGGIMSMEIDRRLKR